MRYLVKNVSLIFIFFLGLSCSSKLSESFSQKKYSINSSHNEDYKETPEHIKVLNKDSFDSFNSFFYEPYVLVFVFMLFLITIITWISVKFSKN